MDQNVVEYEENGIYKVNINTSKADIIGTFYDNSSNKGIILLPGFTEHRSSLDELAKKLSKDFKIWTFDINSQGESTGNWNLAEMVQSFHEVEKLLKERYGLTKLAGYGNSMGGMIIGINAAENGYLESLCMTSTPAGLQDTIPGIARKLLKNVPQSLFRQSMIAFDVIESATNDNYKNLSHKQFKTDEGYQPYAQFGGMKIPSLKDIINWIEQAPRLDDYSHKITKPSLFIYGGNDSMLGIKDCMLPEKIEKMYNQVGSKKRLIISPKADHSLNTSTKTDDCFNQDIRYFSIKLEITKHFLNSLL